MTSHEFAVLALLALCLLALALLIVVSVRHARDIDASGRHGFHPNEAGLDVIAQKPGARPGVSEEASPGTISDRMDEMRRDFDWRVSDRMIEQAVDTTRMARAMTASRRPPASAGPNSTRSANCGGTEPR